MDRPKDSVWVEKYRPKTISDISSQDEVADALRTATQNASLPHLLFFGPPGTGKTSTILALARDMFGTTFKQRVLELNASDERGISVVREKVKTFASVAVSKSASAGDGKQAPPFKLIILDEADSMTGDAQSALRRIMEKYTRVTRFCLICNYVSRIIEPLASRCAKFRFKPLPRQPMIERLNFICQAEGVEADEDAKNALLEASNGDMRRAITLLQCAAQFNALKIDRSIVVEVSGALPVDALSSVWNAISVGPFDAIIDAVKNVLANGYSTTMLLTQFHDLILNSVDMHDSIKSTMLLELAKADRLLVDGADETLQLLNICSTFFTQMKNHNNI
jgi:replication factor C subunit 2/4